MSALPNARELAAASAAAAQDAKPPAGGKKRVKVNRTVNGQEVEEWIEVDEGSGPSWPARESLKLLDHDLPRIDGPAKVTGAAKYSHDMRPKGMVWARLLLCPKPAAKITKLDCAPALAVKGVVAAIPLEEQRTRYLGQPVAAVAAETPEAAEDGLRAIAVEYADEGWVVTLEQAVKEGAPKVSPNAKKPEQGNRVPERKSGNEEAVDKALAGAAAVVEATYSVPVQHHACLETHGIVCELDGERAIVHASTQGTFTVLDEAAEVLGLPANKVKANVQYMGGGFGSKFGLGVEGDTACRLAKQLGRSVHLMLTRADEFLMAGNRSGSVATLKGGMAADGELVALRATVDKLGGLQPGSYATQPYVYSAGAAQLETRRVLTNLDAARAMRAPGHPQASFAMESLLDELAYQLGLDLLEVRKRNLKDPVYHRQLGRVAKEIGWAEHPNRTKPGDPRSERAIGIGFAVATWGGGGGPQCEVTVRIERDGSVSSSVGTQDLGTGTRTYVASIVAEVLGLPLERVEARIGSSDYGPANPSGGSTTVASLAPAVLDAAWKARQALLAKLAETLKVAAEDLALDQGELVQLSNGRRWKWAQACSLLPAEGLSALGKWVAALTGNGVHGAQAAKVEVDTLTGRVRVLKMVGMQDCGLPLNRLTLRSQMNGGMIQALSYALLEERVIEPWLGAALSANLETYKLAGTLEMPELVAIIDDEDTRGTIGMSEAAIIPGHSAIANAVHNACGLRVRSLPLTPDKILTGLEQLRRKG